MSATGRATGRRIQALAYTLVTTSIVLALALAEWGTEKLVSEHSRAAGTTIEIAIVLVAALVFRPIHSWMESTVERAIFARKHHAIVSLERVRRELTSYSDMHQLLRRVTESIDHYLEARACAIYVRRDVFRAEASSFDVPLEPVDCDDALVIRFHSSATSARPPLLKSAAHGTDAFAMMAAGELVGFITVDSTYGAFDTEELETLGALAHDLGIALIALDPDLRLGSRSIPNNLPADLTPLLGREHELLEIGASLLRSRLLTITGPGGVGKTRVALRSAVAAMDEHEHGVWFVDLSPIMDAKLVTPTILAAMALSNPDEGSEIARLTEYLRSRHVLLLLDNCEQVIEAVSDVIAQIRSHCPHVTVIATSREVLHLEGEQVYRLGPLNRESACALFVRRAAAVDTTFEGIAKIQTIERICERLDGIPLAIELAAARVRALSVDDIFAHLDERFRLLTNSNRNGGARHHTLSATIAWSYDLMTPEEQSLFLRLGVFRGSFSLPAAAAVCARAGTCDEMHVLDVLTSLADKSLLNVTISFTTRYRFLDSIGEFARGKAIERKATEIVAFQHAAYFNALSAQAYHEFDTQLPAGWLDGLSPDVDNFRAALEWSLQGGGDRRVGAELASGCGPIFLRSMLLTEWLHWYECARTVPDLDPATLGRLEYVASMTYNNLGDAQRGLECAERALALYRRSGDLRGLVRTLSQVAQRYGQLRRFDDARAPAEEAIEKVRVLNEPRILASVLRRCAYAFPPNEVVRSRELFAEALAAARGVHDANEEGLVLEWWAGRETEIGNFEEAIRLSQEGLQNARAGNELFLELRIASCALAMNDVAQATPHARRALELAEASEHQLVGAIALAYCVAAPATTHPIDAAKVLGYARSRLDALGWEPTDEAKPAFEGLTERIASKLDTDAFQAAVAAGALITHDEAMRVVLTLAGEWDAHPATLAVRRS